MFLGSNLERPDWLGYGVKEQNGGWYRASFVCNRCEGHSEGSY